MSLALLLKHYEENFDKLSKSAATPFANLADGEDCVQDAYYNCHLYIHTYDGSRPMAGWFKGILINCVRKKMRDVRYDGMVTEDEGVPDPRQECAAVKRVDKRILAKKEPARTILTLYFYGSYRPREIAKLVRRSPKAVSEAIARFKRSINEES